MISNPAFYWEPSENNVLHWMDLANKVNKVSQQMGLDGIKNPIHSNEKQKEMEHKKERMQKALQFQEDQALLNMFKLNFNRRFEKKLPPKKDEKDR